MFPEQFADLRSRTLQFVYVFFPQCLWKLTCLLRPTPYVRFNLMNIWSNDQGIALSTFRSISLVAFNASLIDTNPPLWHFQTPGWFDLLRVNVLHVCTRGPFVPSWEPSVFNRRLTFTDKFSIYVKYNCNKSAKFVTVNCFLLDDNFFLYGELGTILLISLV